MTFMKKAVRSRSGSILISIVLGLGLATVFQKACKGNCVIIKAPASNYITQHVWSVDDTCYKYTPRPVDCTEGPSIETDESIVEG